MSVNSSMEVTGYYYASSTVVRGFLRGADGTMTTFDVAGATWTQPEGINAAGNITGYYDDPVKNAPQGFLRYADGHTITFEADPTFPYDGVLPVSINDFDVITGNYFLEGGKWPPFTRSGGGVFSTPAAPILATAVNASGSVVGYSYLNPGGIDFSGLCGAPEWLFGGDRFRETVQTVTAQTRPSRTPSMQRAQSRAGTPITTTTAQSANERTRAFL
jgi:hypothetical protein